jgi:hypothetical protein
MSKYSEPKEKILKILKEKGEISQKEAMEIMDPYFDIDIEKLKEQELRRIANKLLVEYKKRKEKVNSEK